MKILIVREIGQHYEGIVLGSYSPKRIVKIDPFAGCYYMVHDEMSEAEEVRLYKSIIGTVLEVPDDCHEYQGVLLPDERHIN